MAYIDSAYYKGKQWCVYDLKNKYGDYREDYRYKMRKESQNHEFTCIDCGEYLILCAGNIREPYFKHYDNSECVSTKGIGKYDLTSRRLIYNIARESFPKDELKLNKQLEEGVRPFIFIENKTGKLAIEYISHIARYDAWENNFAYYKKNRISVIYILNAKHFTDAFTHYGYMFYTNLNIWGVLNSDTTTLYLRHMYMDSCGNHLIEKEYYTDKIKFLMNGLFDCDFETHCREQFLKLQKTETARRLEKEKSKQKFLAERKHQSVEARKIVEERARRQEQKEQQLINEISQRFMDENVQEMMASSDKPVFYDGVRCILCKYCKKVKPASEFSEYGGIGSVNLGTCYDCR